MAVRARSPNTKLHLRVAQDAWSKIEGDGGDGEDLLMGEGGGAMSIAAVGFWEGNSINGAAEMTGVEAVVSGGQRGWCLTVGQCPLHLGAEKAMADAAAWILSRSHQVLVVLYTVLH